MVTVAIGDVHGCGRELQGLLAVVDAAVPSARLVFVGDLLTKGDHPELVIRTILDRRESGAEVRLVCGNHDLRLLAALVRVQAGTSPEQLPKHERQCWHRLARHGMLRLAMRLMVEATETTEVRSSDGAWTIVHGGIDPRLGLADTPDDVKIHIKALEGEQHWWERYDGSDGLIVVGHKPLNDVLMLRDAMDRPFVVNVDTGCVYGGFLTAYAIEEDLLLSAPSALHGYPTAEAIGCATVRRSGPEAVGVLLDPVETETEPPGFGDMLHPAVTTPRPAPVRLPPRVPLPSTDEDGSPAETAEPSRPGLGLRLGAATAGPRPAPGAVTPGAGHEPDSTGQS